jgi:hypothetical protein
MAIVALPEQSDVNMQRYNCKNCDQDATGGSTIICEGVFMKICKECAEDKEIYKELEKRMMEEPIGTDDAND